jgi:16S rRNA (cytosine1402-N4)-methyltransferase
LKIACLPQAGLLVIDHFMNTIHKPVLLKESIDFLNIKSGGTYVDLTLGGGGHTTVIGSRLKVKGGKLICFDQDEEAIERFNDLLMKDGWKQLKQIDGMRVFANGNVEIIVVNRNFEKLSETLDSLKIKKVDGIIADLGVSSDQLESSQRGFGYSKDGPLDMRMSKKLKVTAADLVNGLYEKELTELFRSHDEKFARRIAKAIINEREKKPIKTTTHLVQIIKSALPRSFGNKQIQAREANVRFPWLKPVSRVFQALRNQVNSELSSLQNMLPQAIEALASGSNSGRLVVISFHSGEDRIVKTTFKKYEQKGLVRVLTKDPVEPSEEELKKNLRARSAKMRAVEKIGSGQPARTPEGRELAVSPEPTVLPI